MKFRLNVTRTFTQSKTIVLDVAKTDVEESFPTERGEDWKDHVQEWLEENWEMTQMIEDNSQDWETDVADQDWYVDV